MSCGTGQRIPCFDSCQLTITWMSNINDVLKLTRQGMAAQMAAMLCDVVIVIGQRTRPRTMPLAMLTMKTRMHGYSSNFIVMGPRSAALRAAAASLKKASNYKYFLLIFIQYEKIKHDNCEVFFMIVDATWNKVVLKSQMNQNFDFSLFLPNLLTKSQINIF